MVKIYHRSLSNLTLILCTPLLMLISPSLLITSCATGGKQHVEEDSANMNDSVAPTDIYHADNDIAMTLKSIIDVLNQGEALDSLDYNYTGILTDGTGHTLYTDIEGAPGIWNVNIQSPDSAVITNLYLGDLLPNALESYIYHTLGMEEVKSEDPILHEAYSTGETHRYRLGEADIIFKTATGLSPAGQEGPLITITVTTDLPRK